MGVIYVELMALLGVVGFLYGVLSYAKANFYRQKGEILETAVKSMMLMFNRESVYLPEEVTESADKYIVIPEYNLAEKELSLRLEEIGGA